MNTLSLVTNLNLVYWSILIGVLSVALSLLLVRRAQARRDAENFSRGFERMSQADIDRRQSTNLPSVK